MVNISIDDQLLLNRQIHEQFVSDNLDPELHRGQS